MSRRGLFASLAAVSLLACPGQAAVSTAEWDAALGRVESAMRAEDAAIRAVDAADRHYDACKREQSGPTRFQRGDTVTAYNARIEQGCRIVAEAWQAKEEAEEVGVEAERALHDALRTLIELPVSSLGAVACKIELAMRAGSEVDELYPVLADLRRLAQREMH